MPPLLYLAYGSNLYPARLASRVGKIETLGCASVDGWRLEFSKRGADGSGKCTLIADPAATAHVAVYAIEHGAKAQLDEIEGLGRGYDSDYLALAEFGRCYIYLAQPSALDRSLKPFDWYKTLVVAGAIHHGFPSDYVAQLSNVAASDDPDRVRAAENLAVMPEP